MNNVHGVLPLFWLLLFECVLNFLLCIHRRVCLCANGGFDAIQWILNNVASTRPGSKCYFRSSNLNVQLANESSLLIVLKCVQWIPIKKKKRNLFSEHLNHLYLFIYLCVYLIWALVFPCRSDEAHWKFFIEIILIGFVENFNGVWLNYLPTGFQIYSYALNIHIRKFSYVPRKIII